MTYRVRFQSNGAAYRKGTWVLHRDTFADLDTARDVARRMSANPATPRTRVTRGVSVKGIEFRDGREADR